MSKKPVVSSTSSTIKPARKPPHRGVGGSLPGLPTIGDTEWATPKAGKKATFTIEVINPNNTPSHGYLTLVFGLGSFATSFESLMNYRDARWPLLSFPVDLPLQGRKKYPCSFTVPSDLVAGPYLMTIVLWSTTKGKEQFDPVGTLWALQTHEVLVTEA